MPYNATSLRRDTSRLAFGIAVLMIVWTAVFWLISVVLRPYWSMSLNLLFNDVALYGFGAPLFWLIGRRVPAAPPDKTRVRVTDLLAALCVFRLFVAVGAMPTTALVNLLNQFPGVKLTDRMTTLADAPWWQTVLYTVIAAPIGEELLFRRFLCDRLRPYGEGVAIVFSAVAFSLFHHNLFQFGYAFAAGILLAYVYLKTGSVCATMLLHGTANFIFGFLPLYVPQRWHFAVLASGAYGLRDLILDAAHAGYLLGTVAIGIAGLVVFLCRIGKINLTPGDARLSAKTAARAGFGNAGTIALLVTVLVLTLRASL